MTKDDLYERVTNRIIFDLENGTMPWEKSWNGQHREMSIPKNATTNKPYRGINIVLLWGLYPDNRYLTFKQARDLGGTVKKGEHGHIIVFYKPLTVQDKHTGEDKKIPLLRSYTVFNVSQCEGLKLPDYSNESPIIPDDTKALIEGLKVSLSHGGDRACYIPSIDSLQMPYAQDFNNTDAYRATLYHELTHWTGHKTRLDRKILNSFGDQAYAREELIAELGGAFMCAEFGIPYQTQHASYLASWLKVLKEDKRAIIQAANNAQKAVDYIRAALLSDATSAEEDDQAA